MIDKALKFLAHTRTFVDFFDHFREEAHPLLEGLESKEYAEVVQDTVRGQAFIQLTLKGTRALLDSEGLDWTGKK